MVDPIYYSVLKFIAFLSICCILACCVELLQRKKIRIQNDFIALQFAIIGGVRIIAAPLIKLSICAATAFTFVAYIRKSVTDFTSTDIALATWVTLLLVITARILGAIRRNFKNS